MGTACARKRAVTVDADRIDGIEPIGRLDRSRIVLLKSTAKAAGYSLNLRGVAKNRYQAIGFPYNRMLKLSSSRGVRIVVPVLSVSWSFVDHSVIIQARRKGIIEHEASDTGGVPRWKSSCPGRLAEATEHTHSEENKTTIITICAHSIRTTSSYMLSI